MKKKIWIGLALLLVMPGLLLVASCAQQTATTKSSAVETPVEKAVEAPEEKAVETPEEKTVEAPVQEEQAQEVAKEVIEERRQYNHLRKRNRRKTKSLPKRLCKRRSKK